MAELMEDNITHQQEHNEVVEELQDLSHNLDSIYDEFFNGDSKANKLITDAQSKVTKIREMVRSHARRTVGDDAKLIKYKKAEKWVYALGTLAAGLIGKLVYDMIKMYA